MWGISWRDFSLSPRPAGYINLFKFIFVTGLSPRPRDYSPHRPLQAIYKRE
jgi:hypothetical protein